MLEKSKKCPIDGKASVQTLKKGNDEVLTLRIGQIYSMK